MCAQPIGFGIKGGLPMNDFLDAARSQNFSFDTTTNRYIIGPMRGVTAAVRSRH